jgi:hypothetical protein
MSKYDPLGARLRNEHHREVELTFSEIENELRFRLPVSAQRPQWWANQKAAGHPQREAWRSAGYDAFLIRGSNKVKFRKVA